MPIPVFGIGASHVARVDKSSSAAASGASVLGGPGCVSLVEEPCSPAVLTRWPGFVIDGWDPAGLGSSASCP